MARTSRNQQDEAAGKGNKNTYVYLRSKDHSWIPAIQVKATTDEHGEPSRATVVRPLFKTEQQMVQCGSRKTQKYSREEEVDLSDYPNGLLPMQNVDVNGNLQDFPDMVSLPFMHEVRFSSVKMHFVVVVVVLCPCTKSVSHNLFVAAWYAPTGCSLVQS